MSFKIQLQPSSILHVPLNNYDQDFTFIVNKEETHTSRIVADLLSPKISQLHQIDSTISEYSINTKSQGKFAKIINLVKFIEEEISEEEIPFYSEVFEKLEISPEYIKILNKEKEKELNGLFDKIIKYQKYRILYKNELEEEIEKISSSFYSIKEEEKAKLNEIDQDILEHIICHPKLQIESEDQLIDIVNCLYKKDRSYSTLYSNIFFKNVSSEKMKEFVSIIVTDDITRETWESLSERLCEEISTKDDHKDRYQQKIFKEIFYTNQEFDGLINFLRKQTNIEDEINVTYSKLRYGDPKTIFQYENNNNNYINTNDSPNSWFCFELKKHQIIPTNYTIRTYNCSPNSAHLKNWILEGSNDNKSWKELDSENDCQYLNGPNYFHTFPIKNDSNESFKFLRIRETKGDWQNTHYVVLNLIEFYGQLI